MKQLREKAAKAKLLPATAPTCKEGKCPDGGEQVPQRRSHPTPTAATHSLYGGGTPSLREMPRQCRGETEALKALPSNGTSTYQ